MNKISYEDSPFNPYLNLTDISFWLSSGDVSRVVGRTHWPCECPVYNYACSLYKGTIDAVYPNTIIYDNRESYVYIPIRLTELIMAIDMRLSRITVDGLRSQHVTAQQILNILKNVTSKTKVIK